jgi:hypothetical protein
MARPRTLRSGTFRTARIWEFVASDLIALQEALQADGMQKPSKDDIASGLIWAARRMPAPVVKAMIESYTKEEAAAFLAAKAPGGSTTTPPAEAG